MLLRRHMWRLESYLLASLFNDYGAMWQFLLLLWQLNRMFPKRLSGETARFSLRQKGMKNDFIKAAFGQVRLSLLKLYLSKYPD